MINNSRKYVSKKVLNGSSKYRKWSQWKPGEFIVCEYLETGIDNYDNPKHIVKCLETNVKEFKEGERIALNSAGGLNKMVEKNVVAGNIIEVTYNGTSTMEKGKYAGKEVHDITVAIMDEADEDSSEENLI